MELYIKKKDSCSELMHYGVKGMKWGVRRFQNKDGSLTNAGKKKLASQITDKNTSSIKAVYNTINSFKDDKYIQSYKNANNSYKLAKEKDTEYRQQRDEFYKKQAKLTNRIITQLEKKYGKYEELDTTSIDKFNEEFEKSLKVTGFYSERENIDKLRRDAFMAREQAQKDTRLFVSEYLGKYGDKKLEGQYSAIYRGGKIVDRLSVNDIVTDAIMNDIDHIHYSSKD